MSRREAQIPALEVTFQRSAVPSCSLHICTKPTELCNAGPGPRPSLVLSRQGRPRFCSVLRSARADPHLVAPSNLQELHAMPQVQCPCPS